MHSSKYEHLLGEASRWCARLAAHDCTDFERRRCEKWRAKSSAHAYAFAEVQRISHDVTLSLNRDARLQGLVDRVFAAGASIPDDGVEAVAIRADGEVPAHEPERVRRQSRPQSPWRGFAAAAGIAAVMLVSWAIVGSNTPAPHTVADEWVLQAPLHSARTATLSDGSVVHIDAGGKLAVRFTAAERKIELQSGRAYFEVAHNAARPFSVTTGGTRTVALGTKFEVQQRAGEAVVTLAEGSVEVTGSKNGAHWRQRLHPGEQLAAANSAEAQIRKVDAQEVVGWSRGWLVFHGTPLVDVLQEINRYSVKQVVAADDSLRALNVAGSFVAGDAQSVVDAIAEVLPIRVVDGGNREIILFKRYDE